MKATRATNATLALLATTAILMKMAADVFVVNVTVISIWSKALVIRKLVNVCYVTEIPQVTLVRDVCTGISRMALADVFLAGVRVRGPTQKIALTGFVGVTRKLVNVIV